MSEELRIVLSVLACGFMLAVGLGIIVTVANPNRERTVIESPQVANWLSFITLVPFVGTVIVVFA